MLLEWAASLLHLLSSCTLARVICVAEHLIKVVPLTSLDDTPRSPNCEKGAAFRSMQIGTKSAPSGSSGVRDDTLESQFSDDPGADIPQVETSE